MFQNATMYPLVNTSGIASLYPANPRWDDYNTRMTRYQLCDMYYSNEQYSGLNRWLVQMQKQKGMYVHIRGIYNPVSRMVNLYSDKVYAGQLDYKRFSRNSALPLVADELLLEPLRSILRNSNFNTIKNTYVRMGEKYGDVFLKVADDPDAGKVSIEILDPKKVKYVDKDMAGNIRELWIEYQTYDDRPDIGTETRDRSVDTWLDIYTKTEIKRYKNEQLVDTWANIHGFVPAVHAKAHDEGHKYGATRYNSARSKIDEINSQASLLNDSVRKMVIPLLVGVGARINEEAINRSMNSNDEITALSVGLGAEVDYLSPTIDIDSALRNVVQQIEELKEDIPELFLYKALESIPPSGVALRQMFDLSLSKINSAMGTYDDALMRVLQMAITVGAVGKYEGFTNFDIGSYDRGELNFEILPRSVFYEGLEQFQYVNFLIANGTPQTGIWTELDVAPEVQAEWLEILAQQDDLEVTQQLEVVDDLKQEGM